MAHLWQWALSIPTAENPVVDATGAKCMVGQRGKYWFLARTCTVPANVKLFFPVINAINFDTPNVCGQGPDSIAVADLRAGADAVIDQATNVSVELDGKRIGAVRRIRSPVFSVALPEDNIFDAPCSSLGGVPAGVFAPRWMTGFMCS
jgi:hypothetical protein